MLRFPGSLTTQLALVMAMAVLAAAAAQLAVLLVERNRTGLIEASGPPITRFADLSSDAINRQIIELPDTQERTFRRRGARVVISTRNFVEARNLKRQHQLERRLQRAMADLGHPEVHVMAATRIIDGPDFSFEGIRPFAQLSGPPELDRKFREIILANVIGPNLWISGAFLAPMQPNDEFGRLFFGALVAVACVLGAAIWMSARLVRPLTDLASAAARLGNASSPEEVPLRGPTEVRRTLSAFNSMSGRVSHLLREKDVMLGALGHDLRTPLASLRIRLESMEPAEEREKAISTIEETTRLLESILDFARTGQTAGQFEDVDLPALVADLTADYRGQGANITASAEPGEFAHPTNPDLMRRLLRNLIDNAAEHAEAISIETTKSAEGAIIVVSDNGPGIPEDQLAHVKEPFYRGEGSRNRKLGGTGLGLALADTIARALNAELTLANRSPHGLEATIVLKPSGAPAETASR